MFILVLLSFLFFFFLSIFILVLECLIWSTAPIYLLFTCLLLVSFHIFLIFVPASSPFCESAPSKSFSVFPFFYFFSHSRFADLYHSVLVQLLILNLPQSSGMLCPMLSHIFDVAFTFLLLPSILSFQPQSDLTLLPSYYLIQCDFLQFLFFFSSSSNSTSSISFSLNFIFKIFFPDRNYLKCFLCFFYSSFFFKKK